MTSAYDRVIEELDFLLGSRFFEFKTKQKLFLEYFRRVYKEGQRVVPVRFQELVDAVFKGKKDYSGNVSVHLKQLEANLKAIYKTEEGAGRAGIRLEWIKKGTYQLTLIENGIDETVIEPAESIGQPSAAPCEGDVPEGIYKTEEGAGRAGIRFERINKGTYQLTLIENGIDETVIEPAESIGQPSAAPCEGDVPGESEPSSSSEAGYLNQSVAETIIFAKKMDIQGGTRIKWIAAGMLWGSVLVGLSILILLLIGFPYWPARPLQGVSLMAGLLSCTCAGILAKPLTRLPGVSFGRWCGEIFYVYRNGVFVLVRYSGTCVVDGCGGSLSLTGEREMMANFLNMAGQRWVLVCKNVPTEHPRTPFDFTAPDRAQAPNGSSEPELARTA